MDSGAVSETERTPAYRDVTSEPRVPNSGLDRRPIRVTLPAALPELTPQTARILLEIVVQLSQDCRQRPTAKDGEQPS